MKTPIIKPQIGYNSSMLSGLIYKLKRPYHLLKTGLLQGFRAEVANGYPSKELVVTVITGTDGKTTSSTMLYHVLKTAGFEVGLLSTVAAYIGSEEIDTGFHVTSPQPDQVQKFMRKLVDAGFTHLVMEVTSHGSYQYRTWGIQPQLSGLTNIANEHLDYHLSYENYVEAKADVLRKAPTVVLNEDDQSYLKVRKLLGADHTIIPYSEETKLSGKVQTAIKERFSEKYNQMNARMVYAMATTLGVSDADFITAILSFPGIKGRMEEIPNRRRLTIIVDFAHTPQALESALEALIKKRREMGSKGRIISVFGCAGLRDYKKRPVMGEISSRLADISVFTAEDPRTENIWSIIRQMKEQLTKNHDKIVSIADRYQAIDFAINKLAKPGDIIAIFGKGHEQSMCYGTTEYPWSDQNAVKEILERSK